ncbi:Nucleotide-binding, alpha-beta plait [Cynara cardunculus var. scolymus]|uniref:Nucleotide-binding, alpha-beta plait n=1 Tax=Cynara cardunculus var. scolymus TaxID=59895 RepID=A0A118K1Y1_CYNCS|nr:Nucleotide-binding, alpha-beta plait [Cynara cardunculus var. scolymus]
MEDLKKRKLEETANGEITANTSEEQLRSLLDPLAKTQLVDLLSKLGCQYPSIAEEIKSVASADPANRKLFVRGLAWNTTTETLCAVSALLMLVVLVLYAFVEHGEIEEGAVIIDKASGKSRGYGFITYKDIDSTRRALEAPSKLIDGRMAVCTLACEGVSNVSSTDQAQRKLYIGGLSPEITSEMLLVFFKKHGEIEEGSVAYDKESNKSRGFGFITYKSVEAAKKAIDDPQKMLGGRSITVKLADNQKNKVVQATQVALPGGMVPVHIGGYPAQAAKPHPYTYPGGIAYPNQPTAASAAAPPPYSIQPQISYTQYTPRKEIMAAPPTGLATYPYYFTK